VAPSVTLDQVHGTRGNAIQTCLGALLPLTSMTLNSCTEQLEYASHIFPNRGGWVRKQEWLLFKHWPRACDCYRSPRRDLFVNQKPVAVLRVLDPCMDAPSLPSAQFVTGYRSRLQPCIRTSHGTRRRSLMEFAGQGLISLACSRAHWINQIFLTTVLPISPSHLDCLCNRLKSPAVRYNL
jgi:hypothetical protein